MNKSNPFVPQGSVLEHNKRRSRMKLAVFCVLAFSVVGLTAMLIQGCKREQTTDNNGLPPVDTNATPVMDTNQPPLTASNPPVTMSNTAVTPVLPPPPVVTPTPPVPPAATEGEYVVVKGDTLGKIAKKNGISLKALEDANPNVQPTKLKVGQKLVLPAGATATPTMSAVPGATENAGAGSGEVYTVKSGDTLTKIAKAHGTTVKAIENENNLTTTKIKVGQKLKMPASTPVAAPAEAPAAAPAPAPAAAPAAPAPMSPPATSGAPGQ